MRVLCAEQGIGSTAFDSIGHGETGGHLEGSSLESRVAQAAAVIDSRALALPLRISACSICHKGLQYPEIRSERQLWQMYEAEESV